MINVIYWKTAHNKHYSIRLAKCIVWWYVSKHGHMVAYILYDSDIRKTNEIFSIFRN